MDIDKKTVSEEELQKNNESIDESETVSLSQELLPENFMALLPLKNVILLPRSIIPIIVGRKSSIQAVEFALKHNKKIFITAQKDPDTEKPTENDVFHWGTRATILQVMRMPNGALKILAEGVSRAYATEFLDGFSFMGITFQDLATTHKESNATLEATWRQLRSLYTVYAQLNEKAPADLSLSAKTAADVDYIADTIAAHITNLSLEDRQDLLEISDLTERMIKLCTLLSAEIEILEAEQNVRTRLQSQMEKSQREYYLNEQLKAIHKELGNEDHSAELEGLRKKIKKNGLPEVAAQKVESELQRLKQMPPLSSEAAISRHYIDWMLSLPWKVASKDTISLTRAEKILEKSHANLTKAKERIIEFLAAKKFSTSMKRSPIICLVGPPGVGKTSLAESIAASLGRKFVRISLGGLKDESEIRGHRRTYIGALPGKIIQAMKRSGYTNPVILLDEIDKMSHTMHGDPASALLEVLDPEQNKTFADHFLDTEYDLSNVTFIATANMLDSIPYPLYDRMEMINLSGYTDQEKVTIAKKFLIPKNLTEHNLTRSDFQIPDKSLEHIISEYTKESGVRQLNRIIAKLMRKRIQQLLKKEAITAKISNDMVKEWLGYPIFKKTNLSHAENAVGIATGLAWTEVGGDVLEIETSVISGKGNLSLTGQLGEVMQESAQAAISYIRSRAGALGLKNSFQSTNDIHIHLPEGATPKDGPSAGITMCTALISALIKKPMKPKVAMTGEITLRGRVLSVGGLKEKLLAARQHDFEAVILPHDNYNDIQEVLKDTDLDGLNLIYAKTMDDVLKAAFDELPTKKAKKAVAKTRKITKK